jgi:hypothetical protein
VLLALPCNLPCCLCHCLQKWTEHNKEQKQAVRQQQEGQQQLQQQSPASQALACWARVSRSARHALRKANVHSVLGLEMRMLDLIEKVGAEGAAGGWRACH